MGRVGRVGDDNKAFGKTGNRATACVGFSFLCLLILVRLHSGCTSPQSGPCARMTRTTRWRREAVSCGVFEPMLVCLIWCLLYFINDDIPRAVCCLWNPCLLNPGPDHPGSKAFIDTEGRREKGRRAFAPPIIHPVDDQSYAPTHLSPPTPP